MDWLALERRDMSTLEAKIEILQMQKNDAFETLAEEREKYDELDKICRAQHVAINKCADNLHEAHLALMAFIDVKNDIYEESRKRAKERKKAKASIKAND